MHMNMQKIYIFYIIKINDINESKYKINKHLKKHEIVLNDFNSALKKINV